MSLTINEMAQRATATAVRNGFNHANWDDVPKALALIHSEVSEALEAHRHPDSYDTTADQVKAFAEELADVIIRVGNLACALGIDIEHAIESKMEYNEGRPYKHGKAY